MHTIVGHHTVVAFLEGVPLGVLLAVVLWLIYRTGRSRLGEEPPGAASHPATPGPLSQLAGPVQAVANASCCGSPRCAVTGRRNRW
jgi:hypothetical protein